LNYTADLQKYIELHITIAWETNSAVWKESRKKFICQTVSVPWQQG